MVNNQPTQSEETVNNTEVVKENILDKSKLNPNNNFSKESRYSPNKRINNSSYSNTTRSYQQKNKTNRKKIRVGAICNDGTISNATGRGACSHHGGVAEWIYE